MEQLELYLAQNSSDHIRRRREIRMCLRALDGREVIWPYEHEEVLYIFCFVLLRRLTRTLSPALM